MVDLERHSVVDVLDDRSVESAKAWLRERPTIEVVSRDRCGLYAQAAREGAPQARQVADRFHLVQNLREAIKEQMSVYGHAHVRPILSEDAIVSARSQQRRARLAHRQSRQEIFDTLQALRQQASPRARLQGGPDTSAAASQIGLLPMHLEIEIGRH